MTKLERLRRDSLVYCKHRGHSMKKFKHVDDECWFSDCKKCGKRVTLLSHPAPNEIDMGGEALALGCKD